MYITELAEIQDLSHSYFFCPTKVWSILHYGLVGESSE